MKDVHWPAFRRNAWLGTDDASIMALSIPEPVSQLLIRGMWPDLFCLCCWFNQSWFVQQGFRIAANFPEASWLRTCAAHDGHDVAEPPVINVPHLETTLSMLRRAVPSYPNSLKDDEERSGEAMALNVCRLRLQVHRSLQGSTTRACAGI